MNDSNVLWNFPIFCEFFQYFVNHSNILWIHKIVELFIIYWNLSKMSSTRTTIFKLIGPCEITLTVKKIWSNFQTVEFLEKQVRPTLDLRKIKLANVHHHCHYYPNDHIFRFDNFEVLYFFNSSKSYYAWCLIQGLKCVPWRIISQV